MRRLLDCGFCIAGAQLVLVQAAAAAAPARPAMASVALAVQSGDRVWAVAASSQLELGASLQHRQVGPVE